MATSIELKSDVKQETRSMSSDNRCRPHAGKKAVSSKPAAWIVLTILAAGLALFAAARQRTASPKIVMPNIDPNRYYAVLLSNGGVYYGKLQGVGSPYPVLHDVYYIQSSVNPQTKATSNVLIRRGKELHAPNEMLINNTSIMLIEPVGADSKVAQLIEESGKTP